MARTFERDCPDEYTYRLLDEIEQPASGGDIDSVDSVAEG